MESPRQSDWDVRLFVYETIIASGAAPDVMAVAEHFGLDQSGAQEALERLHAAHALFLDPVTRNVRIANPFSAVPTPYVVHVDAAAYWANCAWDLLGVPVALHADAELEGVWSDDDSAARFSVQDGELLGPVDGAIAHFAVPVNRWYDDLVDT